MGRRKHSRLSATNLTPPRTVTQATPCRLPAPVRELVDRLVSALDRIDDLEAERERCHEAQRRLTRRARAAMARMAS